MTGKDLVALVEQYRAGLDAELMLLGRLQALSVDQRRASETGAVTEMQALADARDRVMATLVTVEHELKGLRQQLVAFRDRLEPMPAFQDLVVLHRQAADMVADVLAVDEDSLAALRHAEQARQAATRALEQGQSTLAAYRRVVTPALEPATLVNRRG